MNSGSLAATLFEKDAETMCCNLSPPNGVCDEPAGNLIEFGANFCWIFVVDKLIS